MITLLHGDLIESSRNELHRIRNESKATEIRALDGKGLDETNLTQAVQSQSMFGDDTLIIIENLFGKLGKKLKLIEALCAILVEAGTSVDIILWEDKELGVSVTKHLKDAQIKVFKTPQVLFQFLDGLQPKNKVSSLKLFQKLVETTAAEIVFTMLLRRVRQLIQLADGIAPSDLQSWQANRLTGQSRSFTIETLISMHTKLLSMDIATKTGSTPYTLSQQLSQFIISL